MAEQVTRANPRKTIGVNSSATGEAYQLTRNRRGECLVACRGGANTPVHFY